MLVIFPLQPYAFLDRHLLLPHSLKCVEGAVGFRKTVKIRSMPVVGPLLMNRPTVYKILVSIVMSAAAQWTGKDDEVARAAKDNLRDVRDSAHAKGREIKDSWTR